MHESMERPPLGILRRFFSGLFARIGLDEKPPGDSRAAGLRGESAAVAALEDRGYVIRERNFRTPVGEIDVIAEEGGALCFIEVKWRRTAERGHPGEAVTREKQRRLARAAEWYVSRHGRAPCVCRFDVVGILNDRIEIYRDAFRGPFPPRRRA